MYLYTQQKSTKEDPSCLRSHFSIKFKLMKGLYISISCLALLILASAMTTFSVSAEEISFYKEIIEKLENEITEMETKLSEKGLDIDKTLQKPVKEDQFTNDDDNEKADEENDKEEDNPDTVKISNTSEAQKDTESITQAMECVSLKRAFRFGDYDEKVTKIQEFLKAKGYFSHPYITPYFGPVTERAVQNFQRDKGIVSYGTPTTTGFGQVGPKTIKAIEMETCPSNNWGS